MNEFMKYVQDGSPAIISSAFVRVLIEWKKNKKYAWKTAALQFFICVTMGSLVGYVVSITEYAHFAIPCSAAGSLMGEGILTLVMDGLKKKLV